MVRLNGQYLMLFMAALLFMWLTESRNKKVFLRFSLAMLLLLIFPPTAWLLIRYQTVFYGHENIWRLLPLTAVLAYGLVLAEEKMLPSAARAKENRQSVSGGKKEIIYEMLAMAVLTVLLFLCGTLSLGRTVTEEKNRMDGLPEEAAILAFLDIPKDDSVYLLAPDEVSSWARIYSGNLLLPYGRDLYEPELTAFLYDTYDEEMLQLHDWINGNLAPVEDEGQAIRQQADYLNYCAQAGYHYLIFSYERYDEALAGALAEQEAYRENYTTRLPYVIYELQ